MLAIVSSAAVNTWGAHVSFQITVFSGYRLHGLLRPMALLTCLHAFGWGSVLPGSGGGAGGRGLGFHPGWGPAGCGLELCSGCGLLGVLPLAFAV